MMNKGEPLEIKTVALITIDEPVEGITEAISRKTHTPSFETVAYINSVLPNKW